MHSPFSSPGESAQSERVRVGPCHLCVQGRAPPLAVDANHFAGSAPSRHAGAKGARMHALLPHLLFLHGACSTHSPKDEIPRLYPTCIKHREFYTAPFVHTFMVSSTSLFIAIPSNHAQVGRNGKPSARVLVLDDTPKTMRAHGGAPVITWRSTSRVNLLSKAPPRLPLARLLGVVAWSEAPPNATPPAHVESAAGGGGSGSSSSGSSSVDAACCVSLYFQSSADDSGDAYVRSNSSSSVSSSSSSSSSDARPSGDSEADECTFELVCATPESARTLSVVLENLMRTAKGLEPSVAPPSPSASSQKTTKPPSPVQPPPPLPAPVPAASNASPAAAAHAPPQTPAQSNMPSLPPRPSSPPPAKPLRSTSARNGAALAAQLQKNAAASKKAGKGAGAAPAASAAAMGEKKTSPSSSPGNGETGALAARRAKVAAKKSAAAAAAAAPTPPPPVSSSSGNASTTSATHADILRRAQEQANAPPGQGNTAL